MPNFRTHRCCNVTKENINIIKISNNFFLEKCASDEKFDSPMTSVQDELDFFQSPKFTREKPKSIEDLKSTEELYTPRRFSEKITEKEYLNKLTKPKENLTKFSIPYILIPEKNSTLNLVIFHANAEDIYSGEVLARDMKSYLFVNIY